MKRNRHLFEQLENRSLLDGVGVAWGIDAQLAVSFVPDGTKVGPESSSLFDSFGHLGDHDAWKEAILKGFQTWARATNANIGVVADDGSDLGVDGATVGDPRFGEIRIAAIPMDAGLYATSIPTTEFVDGTWAGDVFFNTNANIETLDELFAVSLHEAGHVFGLDHSDDPTSPMFRHELPDTRELTPGDVAAVQQIFGSRQPDSYESDDEELPKIEIEADAEFSTPGILFGDIQSAHDVDEYQIRLPDLDAGSPPTTFSVVVRLVTNEISLLKANLELITDDGMALGTAPYTADRDQRIAAEVPSDLRSLSVRVTPTASAPFDVGGYSIVVEFPETNAVTEEAIQRIATDRIRSIDQGDIQRFLSATSSVDDDDSQVLVDDDMGEDDDEGGEVEIAEDDAFPTGTRFVTRNALSSATDVDRHQVRVPEDAEHAVISLYALTPGMKAQVSVSNAADVLLPARQIINGTSAVVVQVDNLAGGELLNFAGRTSRQLATGNRKL